MARSFVQIMNLIFNSATNRIKVESSAGAVTPVVSGTAVHSNISASATVVTLLAANTNRLGASFYNDSTSAGYIKFGTGASDSSFVKKFSPGEYMTLSEPIFTGQITAIWVSANGTMRVTEVTA